MEKPTSGGTRSISRGGPIVRRHNLTVLFFERWTNWSIRSSHLPIKSHCLKKLACLRMSRQIPEDHSKCTDWRSSQIGPAQAPRPFLLPEQALFLNTVGYNVLNSNFPM